ncbi:MAG: hypothetical protein IT230_09100 [Flavobacteriales bacterium]|nr:hypothetical protein [Flavobacteriales bacterium]
MKKRALLLVLLAGLGALAWWLWKHNTGSTFSGALTDFAVADTASVDRIFIAEKSGGTADLRRTSSGWTVNGMPAKDFQVALLLKTFKLVELRAPVPKSMEGNVLRVMTGTARKVEIYQGGSKPSKIWWVGGSSADHYGTYMVLEVPGRGRSEVPFEMGMAGFTGVLNTRFHTIIDDWRSSRVTYYPTLADISRVEVEIPGDPSQGYNIAFKGGDSLVLHDGLGRVVPMDTLRVQDVMLALRNGSFEGFERSLPPAGRDSVLHAQPWYVLRITSTKGVQRIPFWRKKPMAGEKGMDFNPVTEDVNRMYALINDTALVVVQRYWWDRVTRPLSSLEAQPASQR